YTSRRITSRSKICLHTTSFQRVLLPTRELNRSSAWATSSVEISSKCLGVKLQLGREFSTDEDRVPSRDAVVILDHGFWKREFASDPSIVGRRVKLGGIDFNVIGVAPETFTGLDSFVHPVFYAPIMMAGKFPPDADVLNNRALRRFDVKGRLKSGVS